MEKTYDVFHTVRCISSLKTTFKREIKYLEVKKQDGTYDWFISSLKYNNQCARIAFRAWNAPSKERLRCLDVLKYNERRNGIKKDTINNFRCCKTLSKLKPM